MKERQLKTDEARTASNSIMGTKTCTPEPAGRPLEVWDGFQVLGEELTKLGELVTALEARTQPIRNSAPVPTNDEALHGSSTAIGSYVHDATYRVRKLGEQVQNILATMEI
jgi:hypothetical protein